MCRALLYLGQPVLLDNLLYQPDSALIRQSYMPKMLHMLNLAQKIRPSCVLGHVRGVAYSTRVEISLQNVHPFHFADVPLVLAHNGDLASRRSATAGRGFRCACWTDVAENLNG